MLDAPWSVHWYAPVFWGVLQVLGTADLVVLLTSECPRDTPGATNLLEALLKPTGHSGPVCNAE
jgi:hypothetical protein